MSRQTTGDSSSKNNPLSNLGRKLAGLKNFGRGPALTMLLSEGSVTFRKLSELRVDLQSRLQVTASRYNELKRMHADKLEHTLVHVQRMRRQLLALADANDEQLAAQLGELDFNVFTEDHDWRYILLAVGMAGLGFDAHRRLAVTSYARYLSAYEALLDGIHAEKLMLKEDATIIPSAKAVSSYLDSLVDEHAKNTQDEVQQQLVRMPWGERLRINFGENTSVQFALASHQITLVRGRHLELVDEEGKRYALHEGKNVIGRHWGCDVVLGVSNKSVSRRHMIIETIDDSGVLVTDISSGGTFVPESVLTANKHRLVSVTAA